MRFDHASLSQAHLDQALLGDTRFWCADLAGARMNRLVGAKGDLVFNGARLDAASLGEARLTAPNLTCASLARADLEGAQMPNAVFARADLSGARLGSARLREASFLMATLEGDDLRQTDLTLADLSDADLTGARLVGADLTEAILYGATLAADLEGAILAGTDLSVARLLSARLDRADLSGAVLANADLMGASLLGAFGLDDDALAEARLCETLDPSCRLRSDDCAPEEPRIPEELRIRELDLQPEGLFDQVPGAWLADRAGLCARNVTIGPRSFFGRVRQLLIASGG